MVSDGTGYVPLAFSETINTGAEVILHRIRLGYPISERIDCADSCCKHCGELNATLLHCLQSCEHTIFETGTIHQSHRAGKIIPLAYIVVAGVPVGNPATTASIQ